VGAKINQIPKTMDPLIWEYVAILRLVTPVNANGSRDMPTTRITRVIEAPTALYGVNLIRALTLKSAKTVIKVEKISTTIHFARDAFVKHVGRQKSKSAPSASPAKGIKALSDASK